MTPSCRPAITLPFAALLLLDGCGAASYVMTAEDVAIGARQPRSAIVLPAVAGGSGAQVRVLGRKLFLEQAALLPSGRLSVRPRRPTALLVNGLINLGIGAALLGAGGWYAYCPPDPQVLCETGIAVGALMGVGAPHVLIGGILTIAAAVKWSPEVGR